MDRQQITSGPRGSGLPDEGSLVTWTAWGMVRKTLPSETSIAMPAESTRVVPSEIQRPSISAQ